MKKKVYRRFWVVVLVLLHSLLAQAQNRVWKDDIAYEYDSRGDLTLVKVDTKYKGNLKIPKEVRKYWNDVSGMPVKYIASDAFTDCTELTSIDLSETSIELIYENTFSGCTQLSSVILPRSLKYIGEGAFRNCVSLDSITIPLQVVFNEQQRYNRGLRAPFIGCTNLKVKVDDANPYYASRNGAVYSKDFSTLYYYPNIQDEFIVPASVTKIGEGLFTGNANLQNVVLHDGIVDLGDNSFSGTSIKSIVIPDGVKEIGEKTFGGCSKLSSVTLNDNLQSIGSYAFSNCNIRNIVFPLGLTVIGDYAFMNNEFEEMTLPESLSEIGSYAFAGCKLKNVKLPDKLKRIEYGTFQDCNLQSLKLSSGLVYIGEYAFYRNKYLVEVSFPTSLETISRSAFGSCTSLKQIILPNSVESIDDWAFHNCTSVDTLVLGSKVGDIGKDAFSSLRSLRSLEIPSNVRTIGDYAFENCNSLQTVNVNTRNCVFSSKVFRNTEIKKVNIRNLNDWCSNVFEDKESNPLHNGSEMFVGENKLVRLYTSNINDIKPFSFYGCESLGSIIVAPQLMEVGTEAFGKCSVDTLIVEDGREKLQIAATSGLENCPLSHFYVGRNIVGVNLNTNDLVMVQFGIYADSVPDFTTNVVLNKIVCNNPVPPSCNGFAYKVYNSAKLYIPKGAESAYAKTAPWANFTNVVSGLPVESVRVRQHRVEFLDKDTCVQLGVDVYPIDANNSNVVWESSNPEVAIIDENGLLTPVANGVCVVKAISEDDSSICDSCEVVVNIQKYQLAYIVDGEVYKSYEVECGIPIATEVEPTKEGYTFSGWSEIPTTMPAGDVTVVGTFAVNKYLVTFTVDGEVVASDSLAYGANIVVPEVVDREGYTFSGWGEVPATVPAGDVTCEAGYTVNSYTIVYVVDGEEYRRERLAYGSVITLTEEPEREGYTFSGWSEVPATMPAGDVTVEGTFSRDIYLTIQQADNGYICQRVFEGEVYRLQIVAAEGWRIHTVTFNGEDVTAALTAEGVYVTPAMHDDAVLNVSYERIDTQVESTAASRISVRGHNGVITVDGTSKGDRVSIYTTCGELMADEVARDGQVSVAVSTHRTYVVKVADKVVKIRM